MVSGACCLVSGIGVVMHTLLMQGTHSGGPYCTGSTKNLGFELDLIKFHCDLQPFQQCSAFCHHLQVNRSLEGGYLPQALRVVWEKSTRYVFFFSGRSGAYVSRFL